MKTTSLIAITAISGLLLVGCAQEPKVTSEITPAPKKTSAEMKTPSAEDLTVISTPQPSSPTANRTEVKWSDYQAGLQADIDQLSVNQDCQGLQTYYGMISATEESVKAQYGHGNEALQKYLDEAVAQSGCG